MGLPGDDGTSESDRRPTRLAGPYSASIGILTYRRPVEVKRCLEAVLRAIDQPMPDSWSILEVLVIDNDPDGSGRSVVSQLAETAVTATPLRYVHEPAPGVANARNRALSEAAGRVLVFIDDDEVPHDGWPQGLLALLGETGAAMVGGPVLSQYTTAPPEWIVEGRFFDRDDPPHGSTQTWLRSGNLAIDLEQIDSAGLRFDPRYRQGEDSAFTRMARANGLELRWSSVGAVTEFIEADRFSPRWRLRREYASNRAWTRSSLDLAGGPAGRMVARIRAGSVAALRGVEGAARFLGGLVGANRARRIEGLAGLAGASGRLVEIMAYRGP